MAKQCGHNVPCGCKDKALTTSPNCNTAEECQGERCAEIFSQECITYAGETITFDYTGTDFIVKPGMRLDQIVQKLMITLSGNPQQQADAPIYRVIAKTSTTLTIEWEGVNGFRFDFNAQQQSPIIDNFYTHPAAAVDGTYTHTFTGLISGADYIITAIEFAGSWEGVQTLVTLP